MNFKNLFDLNHTAAEQLLKKCAYPWEALAGLKEFVEYLGENADKSEFSEIAPQVWVHKSACVSPSAYLGAPCLVCADTQVRQGAYIRGSALVGKNCVVGNSCEIKNAVLFDGVQVPHFNYVGDSILGFKAHMGAGAITSNVKADKSPVRVSYDGKVYDTGRKKLGALVGDFAEIGCNAVLCPGAVVGRNSVIYPLSFVRGFIPGDSVLKSGGVVAQRRFPDRGNSSC